MLSVDADMLMWKKKVSFNIFYRIVMIRTLQVDTIHQCLNHPTPHITRERQRKSITNIIWRVSDLQCYSTLRMNLIPVSDVILLEQI